MNDSSHSELKTRPSGGFELWAWLFMRLSGLALLLLAIGHLVIMHLLHNVDSINFSFVAGRYRFIGWRLYDLSLLLLALFHGLNGLRIILEDYLKGFWRTLARVFVVGALILF